MLEAEPSIYYSSDSSYHTQELAELIVEQDDHGGPRGDHVMKDSASIGSSSQE